MLRWDYTYRSDTPCCATVYPRKSECFFDIPGNHLLHNQYYLHRALHSRHGRCDQPNIPLVKRQHICYYIGYYIILCMFLFLYWEQLILDPEKRRKFIPTSSLSTVGSTELFQCNYDYNLLDHLPEFYKQIIHH